MVRLYLLNTNSGVSSASVFLLLFFLLPLMGGCKPSHLWRTREPFGRDKSLLEQGCSLPPPPHPHCSQHTYTRRPSPLRGNKGSVCVGSIVFHQESANWATGLIPTSSPHGRTAKFQLDPEKKVLHFSWMQTFIRGTPSPPWPTNQPVWQRGYKSKTTWRGGKKARIIRRPRGVTLVRNKQSSSPLGGKQSSNCLLGEQQWLKETKFNLKRLLNL